MFSMFLLSVIFILVSDALECFAKILPSFGPKPCRKSVIFSKHA